MEDTQPIIKDNKPTCLPFRGPLQKATEVSSSEHLKAVLLENELLINAAQEIMEYCSDSSHLLPLLDRLHKNLAYLAILKETTDQGSVDLEFI